jgi:hypothetical protein
MRARSGIANSDVISPDNDLIDLQAAMSRLWEPLARSVRPKVGAARTMLERTAERFGLKRGGWRATVPMDQPRCRTGSPGRR